MDFKPLIAKQDADFNEEQTKHALVLPILDRFLGWDIYDETKVVPEFIADTPGKNGEKVDYALDVQGDGNPEVLIEVKALGSRLNNKSAAQLYRYFTTTNAVVGILTDGFRWIFYTDLEKPNVMDQESFLDFDLEDLSVNRHLEKLFLSLSQDAFNVDYIREWAKASRDEDRLADLIRDELSDPSDELVKLFYSQLNPGLHRTGNRLEIFKKRLTEGFQKHIDGNEQGSNYISPIKEEYQLEVKKHRKGYFETSEGHVGKGNSLRVAWVNFWSSVMSDPFYKDKLISFAEANDPKGIFAKEEKTSYSDIGNGIYVINTLSSERRLEILDRVSLLLGIRSSIVYTDEESEMESGTKELGFTTPLEGPPPKLTI